jgi:hypothetical protein
MDHFISMVAQCVESSIAWSPWLMKEIPDEKRRDELARLIREHVAGTMLKMAVLYKVSWESLARQAIVNDEPGQN